MYSTKEEKLCICIDKFYKQVYYRMTKGRKLTAGIKKRIVKLLALSRKAYQHLWNRHVKKHKNQTGATDIVVIDQPKFIKIERKLDMQQERLLRLVKHCKIGVNNK